MATGTATLAPFQDILLPDGSDPVSKGIVKTVQREDGVVTVEVAVDGLGDDLAERIVEQIRGVALSLPGSQHVRVVSIRHPEKSVELPEVAHVLAVASAKGGVGKTTVAVALARTLAERGVRVGLFDADIYGPNVPHVLDGVEGPVLTNEQGNPVPLEVDGIQLLSPGLVAGEPPTARRGAIAYGAVENLLAQGAWTDCEVMMIDLPAGSDDVVGATLEHVPVDGAIFVTTPFDASVDDTRRTLELFEEHGISSVAAVVNMNGIECARCGELNTLFEDPVDLDAPVIHELPFDRALQTNPAGSAHDSISELADTVETFLDAAGRALPDDVLDLRGLPQDSTVRQLSDELATVDTGCAVRAIVDDRSDVPAAIRVDARDLLGDMAQAAIDDDTVLLELWRD